MSGLDFNSENIFNISLDSVVNLDIPKDFKKLIKRLKNFKDGDLGLHIGDSLGDILKLAPEEIGAIPGVGRLYVDIFISLKKFDFSVFLKKYEEQDYSDINLEELKIVFCGLSTKVMKTIKKVGLELDEVFYLHDINYVLNFDSSKISEIPGLGVEYIKNFNIFKNLVKDELMLILENKININLFESKLIVPCYIEDMDLKIFERIILEDIEYFFEKITEDNINILQMRWGFIEDKKTLEEIGGMFNVSRERIRQKESKIKKIFISHMRLSQDNIWFLLKKYMNKDITLKLDSLFSCFKNEKDFFDFMSEISGKKNLHEYVYPNIDNGVLNTFFVENGSPLNLFLVKDYLEELNIADVDNILNLLVAEDIIRISGDQIWPKHLSKSEAAACVLLKYKKGLPWLDVSKLVNENGFSRTPLYEIRVDSEAFHDQNYILLAGVGVYKHIKFIDQSIVLDDLFMELMEYQARNQSTVFHLNQCYGDSEYLKKYDYYDIRYYVKNFGEDYGFYFNGRSQSDSVSIKKNFKKITQKEVIIQTMNRLGSPLTRAEIANLLKSKSAGHAAFYLDQLMGESKVVQVKYMLYTTPDIAYKHIDINSHIDAISCVLKEYDMPVEPSILKNELNSKFNQSFSKHFYASIARLYCEKQGWYRKQSIYSFKETPYESLKDVLDKVCNLNHTVSENIAVLKSVVAITDDTALIAIRNWKSGR
ncbi:sigma factor-like helix-turn-helix DNA-binding protein [Acinetobacter kyonggiensis]|uniref:Sigma-70, region 4 n=1 Tax=Acinetobacter kyonggiensis TaxID=595670 RepID=A0A1H3HCU6_9GAMM|nr:sigma factor-like helix-turn-helix DNA-binding protein [Acinetobacter kyonggiensis]SDY13403.1 Sigma-70, region 4 [Acinetobacter kyonggiensis]